MATSNEIEKIKKELVILLSYKNMKDFDKEAFKGFVKYIFSWLDLIKKSGLEKKDIKETINSIYYNQSFYFEIDEKFSERLGSITDEIIEFCPDPFFWSTDINDYLFKWNRWFEKEIIS